VGEKTIYRVNTLRSTVTIQQALER